MANETVVKRYEGNPIITPEQIAGVNSVFNSAVVPFEGRYAGVFRCDETDREMTLHVGFSDNGIDWDISPDRINLVCDDPEIATHGVGYDPRVIPLDGTYYVNWCNNYHGPTIGLARTDDFQTFYQMENMLPPYNRNGVLFPRKIGGKYAMLHRPSDRGHTPFGDMYYCESPDLMHWGKQRFVFGTAGGWQSTKVGPGPVPIETDEGWLCFYHGVLTSCNGFVYAHTPLPDGPDHGLRAGGRRAERRLPHGVPGARRWHHLDLLRLRRHLRRPRHLQDGRGDRLHERE
jgi:beta-1,4-mannooligosaccharide/beta-1,4-mannosyl-N-acetylglucosamine phosphorylase